MSGDYQRTTVAIQNDTLDAIAYRIYAHRSRSVLPQLIDANNQYSPVALLPQGAVIVLPTDTAPTAKPSIKLWD